MKKYLSNKAGVTILEGVIALGLLALVTAGAFGVLLSAARQGAEPDLREEMALAVGKVNDLLKMYQEAQSGDVAYGYVPEKFQNGLCGGSDVEADFRVTDTNPLGVTTGSAEWRHHVNCMLPPICDRSNGSMFYYVVREAGLESYRLKGTDLEGDEDYGRGTLSYGTGYSMAAAPSNVLDIRYTVRCNGYEL